MKQAIFFEEDIESNYLGHQMAEIYKDKVYEPFVRGKRDLVIVDIGANIGLTAYYFSKYAKQIYAIEPAKEHFDNLAMMIEFNKLANVKPINKAIYIKDGLFPLWHHPNKTMYSLHMSVRDLNLKEEIVECVTMEKLFTDESIDHVDILKIDIEGTETEVLSSNGFANVANRIDLIVGEIHNWSGRHPHQIVDALELAGFKLESIPNDASLFVARRMNV